MTYPQQQYPQPPTGYGFGQPGQYPVGPPNPQVQPSSQQQYYGAPQGTPWMPQQYGGAPAGTPPQAAPQPLGGQGMPTSPPPLGQSARTGEGGPKSPQPRHLIGRTVIFEPVRIDETTMVTKKNEHGQDVKVPAPTAHYHLTVVDGGPLQYGDNRDHDVSKQHGMTFEIQTPCRFLNVQSDRFGIVNEVRDAMARGDAASVGVIVQGTRGNRPFLVTKVARDLDGNERPDGDQRFQAATMIWNQIFSKTFTSPEPRSLVVAPPVAPPPVQYAQQSYAAAGGNGVPLARNPQGAAYPQGLPVQQPYQPTAPAGYAQQQYAQTGIVPTPYGAAPAGQLHPEYVAAATQPAYVPQQTAPPVQSAPPANPFEAWLASFPPDQQAAMRAQYGQQAPAPQGPGI